MKQSSTPFFCTLKTQRESSHPSVSRHTVTTWTEYSLYVMSDDKTGAVSEHLFATDRINGQWDGGRAYGIEDTKRITAKFSGVQS